MPDLPAPHFLDERLAHWAATKPDEEALTYLGRTWTWSQWSDRIRRLAGALNAWGAPEMTWHPAGRVNCGSVQHS